MFAYCNNNPSNFSDTEGQRPISALEHFGDTPIPPPPEDKKVIYDVPLYDQEDCRLCWAVCQTMIESYKLDFDFGQENALEIAKAFGQCYNGWPNWNRGALPSNAGEPFYINTIDDLYDILTNSGPVYALYKDYDTGGEHLVVVKGVNVTTNTVYSNNPWGYQGKQTFEKFLTSIRCNNPDMYDYRLQWVYPVT